MEELLDVALRAAESSSIVYTDARLLAPQRYVHLAVRNGRADALTQASGSGLGVRVRTAKAWGFASTSTLDPAHVRSAAKRAVRLARGASRTAREVLRVTSEHGPRAGRYESSVRLDPFEVGHEELFAELAVAERRLHVAPAVKSATASFEAWEERKWFASSEGVRFASRIVHAGGGVAALAVRGANVQRRSGPTSFGGNFGQAGLEFFRNLALSQHAEKIGREAVALLDAPRCPTGRTTLLLASDQLALQVHESVGHAVELDRILGSEAGYAGTSWVVPETIGSLRYGSEEMHVTADATVPTGLGTFGWDDEGVPARRTPIVTAGVLVGSLSSREWAARVGARSSGGTARAEGPDRAPLVRMTNVNLEPGDRSFDELLEGVDHGVFLETNRSWSIDDRRLNFQFGTETGRLIEHGELGRTVRNPIYAGMTPEFWGSMDAVGDRSTWQLWGVTNCGKGQPGQVARVGHGAPVARFRSVEVRGA